MEVQHLLRVTSSPTQIAKNFSAYCKRYQVVTRGLCKIGFIHRSPIRPVSGDVGKNAITNPFPPLRGLIANKDLKKGENVVMLSERACLHPGRALRCTAFLQLLPLIWRDKWIGNLNLLLCNERLHAGSPIRHHQFLLALYMTYMIIGHRLRPEVFGTARDMAASNYPPPMEGGGGASRRSTVIHDADVIEYLDFIPRTEGDFRMLSLHLARSLDNTASPSFEMVRDCESVLAKHFDITPAEVRAVVLYTLCMLFSRVVPVDHKGLLQASFRYTPFEMSAVEQWLQQEQQQQHPSSSPSSSFSSPYTPSPSPTGNEGLYGHEFVKEPLSFLCPIIDMCNHSHRSAENVAVMVPTSIPPAFPLSSSAASTPSACQHSSESQSSLPTVEQSPHTTTSSSTSSSSSAYAPSSGSPIICLRTLRDVPKGEELTMCYSDSLDEQKLIWGIPPEAVE